MLRFDDMCAQFFADCVNDGLVDLTPGLRILEIGCGEFNFLKALREQRPDLTLVGIDVRDVDDPAAILADVLTYDFPPASFDAVIAISALEHIGLGFYGDPVNAHGDTLAMDRAAVWVKPGGWAYYDVPYSETLCLLNADCNYRRYDPVTQARLCPAPWVRTWERAFTPAHRDAPYRAFGARRA